MKNALGRRQFCRLHRRRKSLPAGAAPQLGLERQRALPVRRNSLGHGLGPRYIEAAKKLVEQQRNPCYQSHLYLESME